MPDRSRPRHHGDPILREDGTISREADPYLHVGAMKIWRAACPSCLGFQVDDPMVIRCLQFDIPPREPSRPVVCPNPACREVWIAGFDGDDLIMTNATDVTEVLVGIQEDAADDPDTYLPDEDAEDAWDDDGGAIPDRDEPSAGPF